MIQYLSTPFAQALSWTLLHSLWQGTLIMLSLMLLLRIIPARHSRGRYALSLGALSAFVIAAVITFTTLLRTPATNEPEAATYRFASSVNHATPLVAAEADWVSTLSSSINANIPYIITLWLVGTIIFCLRMVGGWYYVNTLRKKATHLDDRWQLYISDLATRLQVTRLVHIAESGLVQAPVVLGYLKPVILLPMGMIAGLTTEQIETILIHELTHIRRHDYIVNLVQTFIEAIFFFNPCVWFVSQQVRNEREHCCDDAVVNLKGSPKQYIYALARLEEVRLSRNGLALALAENKNVLLNRIKRMMEKSAKRHAGRERIVPAVLLVIGLLCASWVSMKKPAAENKTPDHGFIAQADTTIKKTQRSGSYSRKVVTTFDKDGKPQEEVTEEYEGDESLRPLIGIPDFDFAFEMPELPPMPEMMEIPMMMEIPNMAFDFAMDSSMDMHMAPHMAMNFDHDMAEWSKEMAKWDEKMQQWNAEHGENIKAFEERMAAWHEANADKLQAVENMAEKMNAWQEENAGKLQEIEKQAKAMEANVHAFEQDLKKQLISDGYLKRDEDINSMNWNNDDIEINGQHIKDEHKARYNDLHKKYFKGNSGRMIYTK